ncbi:hypothetical protein Bp8pS_167 [Bacillus phage vB_BpuM-BpSp]|nr:hypothetical protein Bp8pS_167 [Bacillus phage vB_BpuM-BpSp]
MTDIFQSIQNQIIKKGFTKNENNSYVKVDLDSAQIISFEKTDIGSVIKINYRDDKKFKLVKNLVIHIYKKEEKISYHIHKYDYRNSTIKEYFYLKKSIIEFQNMILKIILEDGFLDKNKSSNKNEPPNEEIEFINLEVKLKIDNNIYDYDNAKFVLEMFAEGDNPILNKENETKLRLLIM